MRLFCTNLFSLCWRLSRQLAWLNFFRFIRAWLLASRSYRDVSMRWRSSSAFSAFSRDIRRRSSSTISSTSLFLRLISSRRLPSSSTSSLSRSISFCWEQCCSLRWCSSLLSVRAWSSSWFESSRRFMILPDSSSIPRCRLRLLPASRLMSCCASCFSWRRFQSRCEQSVTSSAECLAGEQEKGLAPRGLRMRKSFCCGSIITWMEQNQQPALAEFLNCFVVDQDRPLPPPSPDLFRLTQLSDFYSEHKIDPDKARRLLGQLVRIHDNYATVRTAIDSIKTLLQECRASIEGSSNSLFVAPITYVDYDYESSHPRAEQAAAEASVELMMGLNLRIRSREGSDSNVRNAMRVISVRQRMLEEKAKHIGRRLQEYRQLRKGFYLCDQHELKYYHFDRSVQQLKQYGEVLFYVNLWDSKICSHGEVPMAEFLVPIVERGGQRTVHPGYWLYVERTPFWHTCRLTFANIWRLRKQHSGKEDQSLSTSAIKIYYNTLSKVSEDLKERPLLAQLCEVRDVVYSRALFHSLRTQFRGWVNFEQPNSQHFEVFQPGTFMIRVCLHQEGLESVGPESCTLKEVLAGLDFGEGPEMALLNMEMALLRLKRKENIKGPILTDRTGEKLFGFRKSNGMQTYTMSEFIKKSSSSG